MLQEQVHLPLKIILGLSKLKNDHISIKFKHFLPEMLLESVHQPLKAALVFRTFSKWPVGLKIQTIISLTSCQLGRNQLLALKAPVCIFSGKKPSRNVAKKFCKICKIAAAFFFRILQQFIKIHQKEDDQWFFFICTSNFPYDCNHAHASQNSLKTNIVIKVVEMIMLKKWMLHKQKSLFCPHKTTLGFSNSRKKPGFT